MRILAIATFVITASLSAVASADEPTAQDPGHNGRRTAFRAMTGPARESVPGGKLLVAAYAAVGTALALFVFRLGLLHSRNTRELNRLLARDASVSDKARGDSASTSKS